MPIKVNKGTQYYALVQAMSKGTVTSMDAFRQFGIVSLQRRLSDLRAMGYVIADTWDENPETGKRFKRYRLVDDGKDVA